MIFVEGAQIGKISDTKDGGWRFYVDIPGGQEGAVFIVALASIKNDGGSAKITVEQTEQK